MARDELIGALRAEIEAAIAATRAALKIVTDIEKADRASQAARARGQRIAAEPDAMTALRRDGMSVPEAAAVLGVSDQRVRDMLRHNEVSGFDFGGRVGWRADRREVHETAERWEAQRRGRTLARDPSRPRKPRRRTADR